MVDKSQNTTSGDQSAIQNKIRRSILITFSSHGIITRTRRKFSKTSIYNYHRQISAMILIRKNPKGKGKTHYSKFMAVSLLFVTNAIKDVRGKRERGCKINLSLGVLIRNVL